MSSKSRKLANAKVPERNLKVTDFFTPKSTQPPTLSSQPSPLPVPATRSRQSNGTRTSSKASTPSTISNNKQPTTTPPTRTSIFGGSATHLSTSSTASRSESSARTIMNASSRTTRSRGCAAPKVAFTVTKASQKCPPSLDRLSGALHPPTAPSPAKSRSFHKRKRKFDSDSETERPGGVIYVQKPKFPSNSPTLAPPPIGPSTPVSSKHIIFSSQSDEMDLVIPASDTRSLIEVEEQIQTWRQKNALTSPASSVNGNTPKDAGTTDAIPFADSENILSKTKVSNGVRLRSSISSSSALPETPLQSLASLPSPPDTEGASPLPVAPLVSDDARRSSQLISNIRAQALTGSPLSDEEIHYAYRELDESSDSDLESMTILHDKKGKDSSSVPSGVDDIFSSPLSSVPSSTCKPSTSYNLRNHNSYLAASPTHTAINTCKASQTTIHTRSGRTSKPTPLLGFSHILATDDAIIPSKRKKSHNPLKALLCEKRAAEKRGAGSAAIQRAEHALGLADEGAAWQAVQEFSQHQSGSPTFEPEEDVFLGEREALILGAEAGAKIEQILISDKNSSKRPIEEEVVDVPFWQDNADDDRMDLDEEYMVSFGNGSNHHILALLQHLSGIKATNQLALILSSGVLSILGPEERFIIVSPLFALATRPSCLCDAAGRALRGLWGSSSSTSKSTLHLGDIISALVTLGARHKVVKCLHWAAREDKCSLRITHEDRLYAVTGLVMLVETAGRTGNLAMEDIPDILLGLALIGLDKTTSSELKACLNSAIDSICQGIDAQNHTSIHRRLLNYGSTFTPASKAHFISFFGSGSGRTRHVAQWLAYALFLPESMPSDALPQLEPLIFLLSPAASSNELFDVTSTTANFEDLWHHIAILSVAIANIEPYVHEESSPSQSISRQLSIDDSPRKNQKPLVPLELLLRVLEVMQGRIIDTRAAHLDRSRTKAAMHRLQMRVYYQRQALKASRGRAMPATIQHYFVSKQT